MTVFAGEAGGGRAEGLLVLDDIKVGNLYRSLDIAPGVRDCVCR